MPGSSASSVAKALGEGVEPSQGPSKVVKQPAPPAGDGLSDPTPEEAQHQLGTDRQGQHKQEQGQAEIGVAGPAAEAHTLAAPSSTGDRKASTPPLPLAAQAVLLLNG